MCLIAKPVKRSECQAFVAEHHRHHKKGSWSRKKRLRQDGLFPQMKKIRWVKVLN